MEFFETFTSLLTLIILEIVLGIDNLIFLAILTEKLPQAQRRLARKMGLSLAWISRLFLLAFAVFLSKLTKPIVHYKQFNFSIRDSFLFIGGFFLITKATAEMHKEMINVSDNNVTSCNKVNFYLIVIQVALMDIIFSLDSVLTAVGLTDNFWIMALAITIAIMIMIFASDAVSNFINRYPSVKMLALSFLILIGTVLVADSFSFHIPRAYVYCAISYALVVETLNLIRQSRLR